jgi:hypothetical protein
MEIEMGLQCIPKTFNENSNIEASIHFNGSTIYNSQSVFWSRNLISGNTIFASVHNTFSPSLNSYAISTIGTWTITKGAGCILSSELPLIFTVSRNAEKFLSQNNGLKKDVFDTCGNVAEFIIDKGLTAIGEISLFQEEDELEPKLFIKYGIANKEYYEILKLWDKACKKIAKSVSVNSLEKIAVIFDQL